MHMALALHSLSKRQKHFLAPYTYVILSSPIILIFPDIINLIKSKRIIEAAHVERKGGKIKKIVVHIWSNTQTDYLVDILRSKNNIKMWIKEVGWIRLAQGSVQC